MNIWDKFSEFFAVIIVALLVSAAGIAAISYSNPEQTKSNTRASTDLQPSSSNTSPVAIIERGENGLVQSKPYTPPEPPKALTRLPDFQIEGLGTHDMHEPVMIVNFFATWCPKCKSENPLLLELTRAHNIPIYGVNISPRAETREAFFKEHENPFRKMGIDEFNLMYSAIPNLKIPTTLVITKDLKVHWHHGGEISKQMVENEILPLVHQLSN